MSDYIFLFDMDSTITRKEVLPEDLCESFVKLISESSIPYIFGTELPMLCEKSYKDICAKAYDPLQISLEELKRRM